MTAPRTLTHKLLAAHLTAGELRAGDDITVAVDQVLVEDATGTMCAMQFAMLARGSDAVEGPAVPLAVRYVDHDVRQIDDKNMQDHRYLRSLSRRYGLLFSPPGHGISHYVHLERFARPGGVLVGADPATSTRSATGWTRGWWARPWRSSRRCPATTAPGARRASRRTARRRSSSGCGPTAA